MLARMMKIAAVAAVLVLGVAQFFQPDLANPPSEPSAAFEAVAKPHPAVAAVIGRSCRNCHSNETEWPVYSRIVPISWLLANDVRQGRARLNFSEWNRYSPEMSRLRIADACEQVSSGKMPPWYYTPAHPQARLSKADVAVLCSAADSSAGAVGQ